MSSKKSPKHSKYQEVLPEYPPKWIHQILARRGIRYADCQLDLRNMLAPESLDGVRSAVDILIKSLQENHVFALVGDYDVDGASGAVLGVEALKAFGAHAVHALLPDRFIGGYGLQPDMVEKAHNLGVQTLITVDNGIAAIEAVQLAKQRGMKVVVTDHHLPGDVLPKADAIVNPSLQLSDERGKNLAGVGVIFYVMCALRTCLRDKQWFLFNKIREPNMGKLLDLVALGTIADMANIDHNNRILIKAGVSRIRAGNARKGIITLLEAMQVNFRECTARDIGFALAPPLNAAGRLQHMDLALDCLLSKSWTEARNASAELVAQNVQRRQLQAIMFEQALEQAKQLLKKDAKQNVLVLYDAQWHQGLTGLVAGMIKDTLGKSTFILANAHDLLVGSARGINDDHLLEWLQKVNQINPELLARFGGHAKAAGFTLYPHMLEEFRQLLNTTVSGKAKNENEDGIFDGELCIENITLDNALLLEKLTPWGRNCPQPLFFATLILTGYQIMGGNHMRMQFTLSDALEETSTPSSSYSNGVLSSLQHGKNIEGVAFYQAHLSMPTKLPTAIGVVFHLEVNRFRGRKQLQLIIKEISPPHTLPYEIAIEKEISYGIDDVHPQFAQPFTSSKTPQPGNCIHTHDQSNNNVCQQNYAYATFDTEGEEIDDDIGNRL